ncbi:MAG TPA: adenylate/guanylate cyclase domain-containing protein [Acetobacteraceae bacterium]|nr:adenylate/guanylate cyclase domain-containing protein [Acetobacteraceae bacterium]
MAEAQRFERRLAAVLMMDVAGYSRLMSLDEEDTYAQLRDRMQAIVEPGIAKAAGRIVKKTGDGALVEFPNAPAAVRCAAEIQYRNEAAAQTQEVERRIRFRIGISLGEVIVADDDIYGDGVNIAARLESIADVGGISISEAAASSSQDSGFVFIDLGLKHLRNITRPIRVYKVALHGETAATGRVAGASLVQGFGERPAIAVLPFRAEAGDSDHSHLADGITEDIITALSRWRTFPVIARASVYAFRDKDLELGFIGHQLGARYIGDGTLHRRGSRLRATVHLHDAETRESLFAENYDHDISDVFEMQDEIVRTIVGAIEPELLRHERERIVRTPLQDASAYELLQRGQWHHYRYTKQDNQQAQDYFRHALSVAPAYARASAALALALVHAAVVGWAGDEREAYFSDAMLHSRNAVQTDPRDPLAQFTLGTTYLHTVSPEEAAGRLREATQLDPSYAAAHANLSLVYNFMNRPEAALPEIELALRLSPHDPRKFQWLPFLAISHYLSGRYRQALAAAQEALSARPDYPVALRYLLATLGQLGRTAEAAAVAPLIRKLDGGLDGTESYMRQRYAPAAADMIVDGLRKSGFR